MPKAGDDDSSDGRENAHEKYPREASHGTQVAIEKSSDQQTSSGGGEIRVMERR
jgi:hypothetical protein